MVLRVVTFKVDEGFLEVVDKVAGSAGVVRSDLIREAIALYLGVYDGVGSVCSNGECYIVVKVSKSTYERLRAASVFNGVSVEDLVSFILASFVGDTLQLEKPQPGEV